MSDTATQAPVGPVGPYIGQGTGAGQTVLLPPNAGQTSSTVSAPALNQAQGLGSTAGLLTKLSSGWAIVIGVSIGTLLGGTVIGPLIAGVVGVGLIFQLTQLVQGK